MAAPSEATAQTHHIHTRRVSGALLIEAAYMTRVATVRDFHMAEEAGGGAAAGRHEHQGGRGVGAREGGGHADAEPRW
jgi:hypothetical protein